MDTITSLRRLGAIAVLALTLVPAAATAAEKDDTAANLEWLRQQTVRIQVKPENGEEENGSGVLLCRVANQAYVLTANHVVFGHDPLGRPRKALDLKEIRISFYKDMAKAVVDDPQADTGGVISKVPVGDKDLLLLSFEVPEDLAAIAKPGEPPSRADLAAGRGLTAVQAIGYSQPTSTSWVPATGRLVERTESFLVHGVPIVPGFSGGPLFSEAGALLGINVQSKGEGAESEGGYALPIDDVLAAIGKWVPASCLRNVDKEQAEVKAAQDAYREAMRQVSLQDWAKAKERLYEALKHKNAEGGSVHLQGMRYTEYLPYFHLGLVLYHQKEYSKALNNFAISEVQGVIQENKRYKTLRKLKEKCDAGLKKRVG
jgi:tetratricopeptide (TPR) repeat protein